MGRFFSFFGSKSCFLSCLSSFFSLSFSLISFLLLLLDLDLPLDILNLLVKFLLLLLVLKLSWSELWLSWHFSDLNLKALLLLNLWLHLNIILLLLRLHDVIILHFLFELLDVAISKENRLLLHLLLHSLLLISNGLNLLLGHAE